MVLRAIVLLGQKRSRGVAISHVRYHLQISYEMVKKLILDLSLKGLVSVFVASHRVAAQREKKERLITITEKGYKILQRYEELRELFNPDAMLKFSSL